MSNFIVLLCKNWGVIFVLKHWYKWKLCIYLCTDYEGDPDLNHSKKKRTFKYVDQSLGLSKMSFIFEHEHMLTMLIL